MANKPTPYIEKAFLQPVVDIIRRIEIYEYDGRTPWKPELWDRLLIDGSVTADHDSENRRSFEVTLDNLDNELDPEAGNLWFDKVFKVMYGIELNQKPRKPKILIAEEYQSTGQALLLKAALSRAGFKFVHYNPQADLYSDVEQFDIIVSISSDYTRKLALLTEAFSKGKSIITFGLNATSAQLPYLIAGAGLNMSTDSGVRSIAPNTSLVSEVTVGWSQWNLVGPQSYRKIDTPHAEAQVLAWQTDATNGISPGVVARSAFGGSRWMHVMQNKFGASDFNSTNDADQFEQFLAASVDWVDTFVPQAKWETQIGEFISDSIGYADDFGDTIKVTGRDYTKRCQLSKLVAATMFTKDQKVEEVIKTLALNCNIDKFNLITTNKTLGKDMTYERDTDRWSIMKEIATAHSYELFFDASGYLTMTEFNDPLLTPPTLVLTTGVGGNLVSRGRKTSDSRLFNHIVVVGESSDSSKLPVWAEAKNENPNSASNIQTIGDRVMVYTSSAITETGQAMELANSYLSVAALEEFELNFSSVMFPWIEPGEILEMQDDETWGPGRFLIGQLTFPLDLSPMSGTGKRVTKVA
ncbi:gp024 [Rhodococcus phage ReqiDocB7]|uniref:tail protein n=1 Tax=Rhodococcus phage ReqiDocB7 TaxID=691966 RepID=UPI0001CDD75A|nr:tail protein [Rhodococcus phage ReqiDocB7]ADD80810.1 gp024 [Rhodococcus phage ReqiDocB7]